MKLRERKEIRVLQIFALAACLYILVMGRGISARASGEIRQAETVRISCVGDSITYGYTSSSQVTQSYPAQLQKLLGDGYQVSNFGMNSTTMLKNGNRPYWNQKVYTDSMNSSPDIVILMLGTNDSKDVNWKNHKGEFESDMKELIQKYQDLPTHPIVYVGLSPRLTVDTVMDLVNEVIIREIVPLQRKVAQEMECPILDIHALSQTMTGDFNDSVHPTDIGYQKIANYIYGELTGTDVSMEILNDTDEIQDGQGFRFSGAKWMHSAKGNSINGGAGDEHYAVVDESNASSHYYEITFCGNRIQVYGHLSSLHGIVKYSVDGGEETEVSSYGPSVAGNSLLYQASGLSDGLHTLRAEATGRKDEAAQGSVIQVDYAKVFTEKKRAVCTCAIESLEFGNQELLIPWQEESISTELHAEGRISVCEVEGHQNRTLIYEFSIAEDQEETGEVEGAMLTVYKPGRIIMQATGKIEGTEIERTGIAEILVKKEAEPVPDTDPAPEPTTEPDIKPEPVPQPDPIPQPGVTVGKVRGLKDISNKEKSITIKWNDVEGADGYLVYRYKTSGKKWVLIADTKSLKYKDGKCKTGTVYQYQVLAYSQKESVRITGESAWLSASALPSRPTLKLWQSGRKAKLSLKKGTRADGFVIEQKAGGKKYREIKRCGAKAVFYKTGKLKKGVSYRFRIRGFKKVGNKVYYSKYSKPVPVKLKKS